MTSWPKPSQPTRAEVMAAIAVLKRKFSNLTAEEALNLAWDILEAVARARETTP